jgi:aspartyl-tRNA(Asn)/glutamyl-tRNA(Gln) amidotransferase subunit B
LSDYDAGVITSSLALADFFEETLAHCEDAKAVANWIMGDMMGYMNANDVEVQQLNVTPEGLGNMIGLIEKGTISIKIAKKVFKEMLEHGGDPVKIVEEQGLVQISDEGEIGRIVDQVLAENPQSVADFKAGKEKAIGFLVGQVMKASKGKANPQMVNQLIRERI